MVLHEQRRERPRIVALGEVLWDRFPNGSKLGGAPANFAVAAASLGGEVCLVSRVGRDPEGAEALLVLAGKGVDVELVQQADGYPTGAVEVRLVGGDPEYKILAPVAWDAIDWEERLELLSKSAKAVCFGTLAQRTPVSRETIQRFVARVPDDCLKVLDLNFRQDHHSKEVVLNSLRLADVLKLNEEEIRVLREYLGGEQDDIVFFQQVRERFGISWVLVTMGSRGCRVMGSCGEMVIPGTHVEVVNTVGAGDAFTAAFTMGVLAGQDAGACAMLANRVGAYVATQESGMPGLPPEFRVFE